MVESLVIGDQIRQTRSRFKNITDYEAYIKTIDHDYESDDAIFSCCIYKIDTLQFNLVNISQYGNGSDFKHEIIEYQGHNCFIPTKVYCFVKCINFITGQVYKQQFLDSNTSEKGTKIMTETRIQKICRTNSINLGFFDGTRVFPRSVTSRDSALFLHKYHFCLIWKSEGVSFNQAVTELKANFKVVDNYITEQNVNSHFK